MFQTIKKLLRSKTGAGLIEYALIAALVLLVAAPSISKLATGSADTISSSVQKIDLSDETDAEVTPEPTEVPTCYVYLYDWPDTPNSGTYEKTGTYTVPYTLPDREDRDDYTFVGWSMYQNMPNSIAYYPGDKYTNISDIKLYAVWELDSADESQDGAN